MIKLLKRFVVAAALCMGGGSAWAVTTTIAGSPSVAVEVPKGFDASETSRGVEIKTPDDEVYVWFELYKPDQLDDLIAEHESYWKEQNVVLGDADRTTETSDGHTIIASAYKSATWKDKPTVVRYLFVDWGFPSHELILMSIWASPDGFKAHGDDISQMIGSIEAK